LSVVARYLTERLFKHLLLLLFGLVALALTFELMEEGDQVLNASQGRITALFRYASLRLADHAAQVLPIACLLAMLLTMMLMIRHAELIALWGSGVSSPRILRALVAPAIALGLFQVVLDNVAVPSTSARLRAWGVGEFREPRFVGDENAVWVVSGPDIVRIPRDAGRAGTLFDIMIFQRTADGALVQQIAAASARPEGDAWLLSDVTVLSAETARTVRLPGLRWEGRIDLENLPLLAKGYRELKFSEIRRLIDNHGFGQQPAYLANTWFYYRLAGGLTPLLMIGLVVSLARWKGRSFGSLLLTGMATGFGFFFFDRTALAMGESGLLPSWFAGFGVKLLLAGLIGTFFVRQET
jgi:lipopolysaccharide export system permease protein